MSSQKAMHRNGDRGSAPLRLMAMETPEGTCVFRGRALAVATGVLPGPPGIRITHRVTVYETAAGHALIVRETEAGGEIFRLVGAVPLGTAPGTVRRPGAQEDLYQALEAIGRSAWEAARQRRPDLLPMVEGDAPEGWVRATVPRRWVHT